MIYDFIAYYKPSEISQSIGNIIKRIRVIAEDKDQIDLVGVLNNFFDDINLSALSLSQPALTMIASLSKAQTDKEVNDILGTLRYFGVNFVIIALPSLTEESAQTSAEELGVLASGYIMLRQPYKTETYSVPVLYSGESVNFKEVPTVGVLMIEILKLLPISDNYGAFTNVKSLLDYYGTTDLETAGYVDVNEVITSINSLGYEYLGLLV